MFTKLSVYGADPLSIRDVNPIGSNFIYNIDHYIANGDISKALATKWREWQALIRATQPYYISRIALRTAVNSKYLAEKSVLTDLEGELTSLDNLRSTNIQGKAMATVSGPASQTGTVAYFEKRLSEIATKYAAKQREIESQKNKLDTIKAEYDAYQKEIASVISTTKIESFFTSDELTVLEDYFQEDNFVDNTFAVFDVDISKENDSLTSFSKMGYRPPISSFWPVLTTV